MPGTSLVKKLLLKPGHRALFLNAPEGYRELLGPLPEGATEVARAGKDLDFVQLFVTSCAELEKRAPRAIQAVRPDGLVWICYPKKSAGMSSDLSRDVVWEIARKLEWDAVTAISIDDVWTALRIRPLKR